jgi:hypothetical protein
VFYDDTDAGQTVCTIIGLSETNCTNLEAGSDLVWQYLFAIFISSLQVYISFDTVAYMLLVLIAVLIRAFLIMHVNCRLLNVPLPESVPRLVPVLMLKCWLVSLRK